MHPAFINDVFAGKTAEAFCWMLIHSLWQGLLFTIITGLVMMLTKKSSAVLRYNIMCALFFLFIAVCAGTFIWELNSTAQQPVVAQNTTAGILNESSLQLGIKKLTDYFTANASPVLMFWFILFFAKCVKMFASLVYSQRVKHHKTHQPPAHWKRKIASLCEQLQVRRAVLLLESEIIKIPVVIGHLKPIIFIPVGLLANLPAGEVEAVLLHELAHIRRNDYFVNIMQVITENIFFFNPALLWMSSLLREERENCCDDVAVAQTQSKKQFIQALISFKEHALHTTNYTTAFPAKKNQLLHRVSRIINNRNKTLNPAEKIFFLVSFVLLAVLSVAVTNSGAQLTTAKAGKTNGVGAKQTAAALAVSMERARATVDNVKRYVISEKAVARKDEMAKYKQDAGNAGAKHTAQIMYEYKKIVINDNNNIDKVVAIGAKTAVKPVKPVLTDWQQAELDRQQAVKDQEQAKKDFKQAQLDQVQARKDREQAIIDQQQAELGRQDAINNQQQADKNRPN